VFSEVISATCKLLCVDDSDCPTQDDDMLGKDCIQVCNTPT